MERWIVLVRVAGMGGGGYVEFVVVAAEAVEEEVAVHLCC